MKYFAISDTHAHHSEAIKALKEAGYDENNDNHRLIVVGDITDRGHEALAHILWLKKLTDEGKAIVLKGNHDNFILGFLKNIDQSFNWMHNGLNTTLDDLDHRTDSFQTYCLMLDKPMDTYTFSEWQRFTSNSINKEYPWLKEWFENLPDYYETKNYVFSHGIVGIGNKYDWHDSDWHDCHWARPEDYISFINPTGKHLVVGHLNASLMKYLRKYKTTEGYDTYTYEPENSMYYDEDIDTYFLDSCTVLSKRVNVLVIDDEPMGE